MEKIRIIHSYVEQFFKAQKEVMLSASLE